MFLRHAATGTAVLSLCVGTTQAAIIIGDPGFASPIVDNGGITNSDAKQVWSTDGTVAWTQGANLGPAGAGDFAAVGSTASTKRSLGQIVESGVPTAAGLHTFSVGYYISSVYSSSAEVVGIQVYGMTSTSWTGTFTMENGADVNPAAVELLNVTNVSASLTQNSAWNTYSTNINLGAAGTYKQLFIRFNGFNGFGELKSGEVRGRIDNVGLVAVPEPAALSLLGLAGLGMGRRRRV